MRRLFTNISHYYYLCAVFFIALIVWLPDSGYDKYFWVSWAQYIKEYGLREAYNNPEINYHPFILFIIKGFTLFFNSPNDINYTNINWLKVPTALFDWGIVFIALNLLKQYKKNLQWALLLAFNPAFWYNTVIWGQFDSIWVFFSLAAVYTATRNSWWVSALLFVLALNTKLFALVFLPVLYPLWVTDRTSMLHLTRPLSLVVALQLAIVAAFLPFTQYSVFDIVERSTGYYESVSRNAYNVWYFIFTDPVNTPDNAFLPWVWLVFLSAYTVLGIMIFLGRINLWHVLALVSLLFFFTLTRMHERYAHAALVFTAILFFLTPSPFRGRVGVGVVFISLAYFLNLEAVMQTANKSLGWNVNYNSILFNPKMVATLYFIACLILAYNIFKSAVNSPSPLGEGG